MKDSKSSTYKLALLRVLARIAEGWLGLTRPVNDEYVAVPLGLVAVFWLRQFKPVLQVGLPQMPTNIGLDGLGLVKDAYRRITHLFHLDFRVAARFTGQDVLFVHQAIRDAVSNIKVMPAKHTSFPTGPRVYGVTSGRSLRLVRELVLDPDYLGSFSELRVPVADDLPDGFRNDLWEESIGQISEENRNNLNAEHEDKNVFSHRYHPRRDWLYSALISYLA